MEKVLTQVAKYYNTIWKKFEKQRVKKEQTAISKKNKLKKKEIFKITYKR